MHYPYIRPARGLYLEWYHNRVVSLLAVTALVGSQLILNRWVVTEQGVHSFGRLWHYFISYSDFGFARRALLGTLLTETGINRLTDDPYLFAHVFYALKLGLLTTLVTLWCLRHRVFSQPAWYALIFLSPAFILQSGYVTGSQDLQLLILVTGLTLFIRNRALLMIGCVIGVLMHELFLFLLPLVVFIKFIERVDQGESTTEAAGWVALTLIPVGLATLLVFLEGRIDVSRAAWDGLMAERTPGTAFPTGNGSGYFEITASVGANLTEGIRTLARAARSTPLVILPVVYLLLLLTLLADQLRDCPRARRLPLLLSCLVPLLATALAADVYRWIGLSANLIILAILYQGSRGPLQPNGPVACLLLLFCLLAPFGGADITRPLPAHQLIWERVAGD